MASFLRSIAELLYPQRFPSTPLVADDLTMRAIVMHRHGPPEVLEYKENVPAPKCDPGSRQVKVEIAGAGLNPVDFKMRKGPISDFLYPKPKIPGSDMAGRVVEVPDGSSFHVGQKVYAMLPLLGSTFGAYAQYCCVDESLLAAAPDNIPLIDCATLPLVACTILQGLRPVRADYGDAFLKGKKCYISAGSGGVGTFAIQFCAKVLGMDVATSCSPRNMDLMRSLGASVILDYHTQPIAEHIHNYDVFIDCMGYVHEELIFANKEAKILNPHHSHYIRIASSPYGAQAQRVPTFGSDPLGMAVPEARVDRLVSGFMRQTWSQWFPHGIRYHFVLVVPDKRSLEEVKHAVEAGLITPVIQEHFSLSQAAAAQELLEEGHVTGKLVLVVNDQL